jgi:hypothetical protein
MADVFISYRRSDRPRVLQMNEALGAEGLSVWFDARLELGQGDGFDAEIEREVTSAAAVLVCWTREALKSVYVRAEAKKGLDRNVLVPVFLEPCTLPVPFNGVDTADLSRWRGDTSDPIWRRVVEQLKHHKVQADRDYNARRARSIVAYSSVKDKVFPGTIGMLLERLSSTGRRPYHADIMRFLDWLQADLSKEASELDVWFLRAAPAQSNEIQRKLMKLIGLLEEIEEKRRQSTRSHE